MDVEDYLDPVDDEMMMENDIYGESNAPSICLDKIFFVRTKKFFLC